MGKLLIAIILISSLNHSAQTDYKKQKKNNKMDLYLSAGSHLSFFHVFGINNPPLQAQLDVNVTKNLFVGAGYSYDDFKFNDAWIFGNRSAERHNVRLRLFNYFGDHNEPVMGYAGGAVGASVWRNKNSKLNNTVPLIPTVQLFIGMKTKIYDDVFNISEIAIGAPYLIQTSFGYKF